MDTVTLGYLKKGKTKQFIWIIFTEHLSGLFDIETACLLYYTTFEGRYGYENAKGDPQRSRTFWYYSMDATFLPVGVRRIAKNNARNH